MEKDYLVTFEIEGIGGSSSYITGKDGKIDTQAVEDEFYAMLRKNEKDLIEDMEEEERDKIIGNLTIAQEAKLKAACMVDYHGDKEHWEDAYERFIEDLSLEEIKKIIYGTLQ